MRALRLYAFHSSSATYRVRLALAIKGLPYEVIPIDIFKGEQREEAMTAMNPLQQVPVLEVEMEDGRKSFIPQSQAICEFIDESFPGPRLLPTDTFQRAQVRAVCALVATGIQPFQNTSVLSHVSDITQQKEAAKAWGAHFVTKGLKALESQVKPFSGMYAHGDTLTLADAFVLPQVRTATRFLPQPFIQSEFPVLAGVCDRLDALPQLQAAHPSKQPDFPTNKAK